jgi:hypothetical protein
VTTKTTAESTANSVVGRVREQLDRAFEACIGFIPHGVARLRELAPYAAIELILPGGSLIALFLWYFQRKRTTENRRRATIVVERYSEA